MPAKLTYEKVKQAFEQQGFKLISAEYESNTSLLDYECTNGHLHTRQISLNFRENVKLVNILDTDSKAIYANHGNTISKNFTYSNIITS